MEQREKVEYIVRINSFRTYFPERNIPVADRSQNLLSLKTIWDKLKAEAHQELKNDI